MKKIIFLDLDATLWENERIPLSASTAIFKAKEHGHKLFVNTGRTYSEGIVPLLPLQFDGYCFSAGSEIYIENQIILYDPLPEKDTKYMLQYLLNHKVGVTLEGSKVSYLDTINFKYFKHRMEAEADSDALQRFLSLPFVDCIKEADYKQFMKLYIYNPHHVPVSILQACVPDDAELTLFAGNTGEITNKKHNKGTAVKAVKKYYHDAYETVAIGDSENDFTMLKEADIAIAMGNGTQEVKQMADFVTSPIDQHGIYRAFQRLGLFE